MTDAVALSYTLQIEGSGISITRELDESALGRVLYALLSGSVAGGEASAAPAVSAATAQPRDVSRLSLREYLNEVGASRYAEKIAAIGLYLERHEEQLSFTKDDVKSRFRTAGEPAPANFHRDFNNAIGAGWIAEDAKASGQYYVTHTGETAISAAFSGANSPIYVRGAKRRRASGKNRTGGDV